MKNQEYKEASVFESISIPTGLPMVLNKLRSHIEPVMDSLGTSLSRAGFSPDLLTIIGFCFALLAGLFYALRPAEPFIAAGMIILSGFFDVLDGAVARVVKKVTKRGSFIDSTLDRVSEIAIYSGIIYAGYKVPSLVVLLALAFSLLVSYVRSKAESLNIRISGIGIGERAERLIALVVFSVIGYVWVGVYAVLILAFITFVQRCIFVTKSIGASAKNP